MTRDFFIIRRLKFQPEAEHGRGRIVALANLIGEGQQAEAALLVEDSWQKRGIGTAYSAAC